MDGERISEVILLFDEEEEQFATPRTCLRLTPRFSNPVFVVKNNTRSTLRRESTHEAVGDVGIMERRLGRSLNFN